MALHAPPLSAPDIGTLHSSRSCSDAALSAKPTYSDTGTPDCAFHGSYGELQPAPYVDDGDEECESPRRNSEAEEAPRACPPPPPRKKKAIAKRNFHSKRRALRSPPLPDIELFFSSLASAHEAWSP